MPQITPRFLVDDIFDNVVQYPGHTITALSEPAGFEANRFSAGRRDQYSSATTANLDWWLKASCNVVRGADMVALWVHNLTGLAYQLQCSDDDFTTPQTAVTVTIPTTPGTGRLDDVNGVLCENGMWLKTFAFRAAAAWRHYVPAMGAGLKPQIAGKVGLSLGLNQYEKPFAPSDAELVVKEEAAESGWIGRGPRRLRRTGTVMVKTRTPFEYDQFRYHFEQRFAAGAPMVIVHDDSQADRAVMAIRRDTGAFGFRTPNATEWPDAFRVGEFSWVECDPREVGATVP